MLEAAHYIPRLLTIISDPLRKKEAVVQLGDLRRSSANLQTARLGKANARFVTWAVWSELS